MESTATSQIEEEIVRLKREVVLDGTQGHSCEQCQQITISHIPEQRVALGEKYEPSYLLDTTVAEVESLAASGCNFWTMISNKVELIGLEADVKRESKNVPFDSKKHRSWWSDEHMKDLAASLGGDEEKRFWHLKNSPVYWGFEGGAAFRAVPPAMHKDSVRVAVRYDSANDFTDRAVAAEVAVAMLEQSGNNVGFGIVTHVTHFWVLASPGTLADSAKTCVGMPINSRPDSSSSMELYRLWLQRCSVTHGCGFDDPPGSMPSLALDVSDRTRVKLFQIPADLRERYVALSYCWGTDVQAFMLTQSKKDELVHGVNPEHLDATIRDAVTVAREMGFRPLWVDALCIVQDDEQWKARELGIMGQIYRNATLTIVVSAAKSVTEGFLNRGSMTPDGVGLVNGHPQPVFKLRSEDASSTGESTSFVLRLRDLDTIEPWYERGWTLQEMIFSRRRLQFRSKQTTWLCHCAEPLDYDCDGWLAGNGHNYAAYSDADFVATMSMLRSENRSAETSSVLSNWYDLIEAYSSRTLRYSKDRLPAISAIAKEFASILGTTYMCGLWKSDLIIGLMWFPIKTRHAVSSVKHGPSWSWASYQGAATWWSHKRDLWLPNDEVEVTGDVTELTMPGELFGEVKSSEIRIRGLLLLIPMPARNEYNAAECDLQQHRVVIEFDYGDDPRVQPRSEHKLGLLLLVNLGFQGAEVIVVLEEGRDRYSRAGWFGIEDVWLTPQDGWIDRRNRAIKTQEELRIQLRSILGGEQSMREIVLI
ncbi:heterokaryon incompatibility protein-domain-containing protein [Boeremia exigua]|uniref:heterokaryon incompatibility protein-domain-containing protein n=1 Tax=Boeremia exigua TaxID=749465 RepID=UPI001E8D433E|nr:heterokaryon incompatibility protein-domain-containing protein [Boeremia exigua]KAH6619038.1 heterokaryon incompatibility protein-domain-containing protein [Boeremia exigua]